MEIAEDVNELMTHAAPLQLEEDDHVSNYVLSPFLESKQVFMTAQDLLANRADGNKIFDWFTGSVEEKKPDYARSRSREGTECATDVAHLNQ